MLTVKLAHRLQYILRGGRALDRLAYFHPELCPHRVRGIQFLIVAADIDRGQDCE
jgi:hypothetical protein